MPLRVRADFAYDGTFSADLTPDIQAINWTLGMRRPYQLTGDGTQCVITLNSPDGKYLPENPYSPHYPYLLPYRRVQVYWDTLGSETILWTGRIQQGGIRCPWKPAGASLPSLPVTLTCVGPKLTLDKTPVSLDPYTDTTVDVILGEILRESHYSMATNDEWILGDPVYSILGSTTILTSAADLDTGVVTLPSYADIEMGMAFGVIKELLDCEQGRFFIQRNGRAAFWNRHHLLGNTAATATVDTDAGVYKARALEYTFGETYINSVRVAIAPRKASVEPETLWTMNDAQLALSAGSKMSLDVDLKTAEGRAVGASTDLALEVTWLNDVSCQTAIKRAGARAILTIDNTLGAQPVTLTAMSVTGTPIISQDSHEYEDENAAAVASYGKHPLTVVAGPTGDIDGGRYLAEWVQYDRGTLRGEVQALGWRVEKESEVAPFPVDWSIGTLLSVDCDERHHTCDYWVMGEQWQWKTGGELDVTLRLERANQTVWLLGVAGRSEPDTAILGY